MSGGKAFWESYLLYCFIGGMQTGVIILFLKMNINMKQVKTNLSILERQLNECYETHRVVVDELAFPYIREAMRSFAVKAIHEDRQKRRKMMVETLKHLPKWMFVGYFYMFRLKLRKWFYRMAVKQARIEASIQNRKIWVVQSTDLTYTLISTKNFRDGKKVKVFKKELDFKDMEEAADATIYPPNQKR